MSASLSSLILLSCSNLFTFVFNIYKTSQYTVYHSLAENITDRTSKMWFSQVSVYQEMEKLNILHVSTNVLTGLMIHWQGKDLVFVVHQAREAMLQDSHQRTTAVEGGKHDTHGIEDLIEGAIRGGEGWW